MGNQRQNIKTELKMQSVFDIPNPAYSPEPDTDKGQCILTDNNDTDERAEEPAKGQNRENRDFTNEDDDDKSSVHLDLSALRCHKFKNSKTIHRVGPVPIAQSTEFISQSTQIAILSRNADGVKFKELQQTLHSRGNASTTVNQSACDALLSYFYELGTKGGSAQVDYHFLDNMLTGEGGKLVDRNFTLFSLTIAFASINLYLSAM